MINVRPRIIPVLLIHDQGVVKTVQFQNPTYIGDPINAIKIFNDKEVDEIIVLDIDASKNKRSPSLKKIAELSSECFMPMAYGGGITSIEMMRDIFRLGVEKIILNHHILKHGDLIKEASQEFGSQSIVVAIDIKQDKKRQYGIYDYCAKEIITQDLFGFITQIQEWDAGEVFINSVDRDGMMQGYDLDLLQQISKNIHIPLIVCGGAGKLIDFNLAIQNGADACAAGSLFVFQGRHKAVLINYPSQDELQSISSQNESNV